MSIKAAAGGASGEGGEGEEGEEEDEEFESLFKHAGSDSQGMMVAKSEAERRHMEEVQRRMWLNPTILCNAPGGEAMEITMVSAIKLLRV
eukprot:1999385-Pyramimonas_sp.AAC.1